MSLFISCLLMNICFIDLYFTIISIHIISFFLLFPKTEFLRVRFLGQRTNICETHITKLFFQRATLFFNIGNIIQLNWFHQYFTSIRYIKMYSSGHYIDEHFLHEFPPPTAIHCTTPPISFSISMLEP